MKIITLIVLLSTNGICLSQYPQFFNPGMNLNHNGFPKSTNDAVGLRPLFSNAESSGSKIYDKPSPSAYAPNFAQPSFGKLNDRADEVPVQKAGSVQQGFGGSDESLKHQSIDPKPIFGPGVVSIDSKVEKKHIEWILSVVNSMLKKNNPNVFPFVVMEGTPQSPKEYDAKFVNEDNGMTIYASNKLPNSSGPVDNEDKNSTVYKSTGQPASASTDGTVTILQTAQLVNDGSRVVQLHRNYR